MIAEMAGLGFSHVELSHGIRISLVPGILKAVEDGLVKVSSCHNFCPLPPGVMHAAPNIFMPSSQDPREQDQWIRNTKRSIDFASQVGASVLVCHLGAVSFFWMNPAKRLKHYLQQHPLDPQTRDLRYEALRDKVMEKIRKRMVTHVEIIRDCLGQVFEHAKTKGVRLGFENRERVEELPLDGEFEAFFDALPPDAPVGYWHDAGHADLKEHMLLLKHREHLQTHAKRLLGFHLHDVSREGQDHQEVGSGRIDFEMLSSFWRPHHLLVLELSPRLETAEVQTSKTRIETLLSRAS